jgi:NADH dehydrogenase (ubiquinone) Fe-S protein 3
MQRLAINFSESLIKKLPSSINTVQNKFGDITLIVPHTLLFQVVTFLKLHTTTQYKVLSDITVVDFPEKEKRFEVVYNFLSVSYNTRIRVKTFVNEMTALPTISSIFPCSNWLEREIWDMYGVYFVNNPDLRRILTDYGFLGNPLKKDFPLTGFTETYYDSTSKTVTYNFVEVSQKQRFFISYSPNLTV